MKEETVTAMNLAKKEANKAWDVLCAVACEVADIALMIESGQKDFSAITKQLRKFEQANAAYEIASAKNQAALLRWQNEFDRRERIVS